MPLSALQDRYAHIAPLGEGGFGEVYRAEQVSTGQLVAIKRLKVDARASQADVGRFARELRIVAGLAHPNIVRLLDTGVIEDGEPGDAERYLVFEFVPGLTLAQHLEKHGPLSLPEATRLMAQVLDALACAHAAGIVHRDVKPQNMMLAQSGLRTNAQLLDFGIAAICEAERDEAYDVLTRDGEAPGTLCYSAPEQIRGQGMSPQVDLFAWGLVFVEALTGERLLTGRLQSDVLRQLLGPAPIALPDALRDQPIAAVLSRALHKDPAQRFATAQAAYAALQACAQNVPPPTEAPAPASEPALEPEAIAEALDLEPDSLALAEALYDTASAMITPPAPEELGRRRRRSGLKIALSLSLGVAVAAAGLLWWFSDPAPTNVMRMGNVAGRASGRHRAAKPSTPGPDGPASARSAPVDLPPLQVYQAGIQEAVDQAKLVQAIWLARSAREYPGIDRARLDVWLQSEPRLAALRAHPQWWILSRDTTPVPVREPRRRRPAAARPKVTASAAPATAAPTTDADWKRFH